MTAVLNIRRWLPAVAAVGLVVATPWFAAASREGALDVPALQAPELSGCRCVDPADVPAWSSLKGADQRVQAAYRCNGTLLSVDVARFLVQKPGKEAVTYTNRVVEPQYSSAALPTPLTFPHGVAVRVHQMDRATPPATRWSWYAVGDTFAAAPFEAKLLELGNALMLRHTDVAIVSLTAWGGDVALQEPWLVRAADEVWNWYLARGPA